MSLVKIRGQSLPEDGTEKIWMLIRIWQVSDLVRPRVYTAWFRSSYIRSFTHCCTFESLYTQACTYMCPHTCLYTYVHVHAHTPPPWWQSQFASHASPGPTLRNSLLVTSTSVLTPSVQAHWGSSQSHLYLFLWPLSVSTRKS